MYGSILVGRPKTALVAAISLGILGAIAFFRMPLADYPELAPPVVAVTTTYPGASPQVVADTVAAPIEDEVNGVDNIYFINSSCNDSGAYELDVTFLPGTDTDINLVNVQNAVKRAESRLPSEVVQVGLAVAKCTSDYVVRFAFTTDGRDMGLLELGNFVAKEIKDSLQRVPGVAQVTCSDREYAMRVWLDPLKMDALGLSVFDVRDAIAGQNIQPAAGFVGNSFASKYLAYKINVRGRLVGEDEFESIVVRSDPRTGARVLLGDVARCELGTKSYGTEPIVGAEPTFYAQVYVDPRANSVDVAKQAKHVIEDWMKRLPKGVKCRLVRDNTEFAFELLKGMVQSLVIGLLVASLALFIMLGSWRLAVTAILPLPLSMAGAAVFMNMAGFSFDALSCSGLIVALGAVIGNSVAVIASVVRESSKDVASVHKVQVAGREMAGFVISTTLVSAACYAPLLSHGGMVGMMYLRFAASLFATIAVSAFVVFLLVPPLAAVICGRYDAERIVPFRPFGCILDLLQKVYLSIIGPLVTHPFFACFAFIVVVALLALPSLRIRKGFLPDEDRGIIKIEAELPEGSTLERTRAVVLSANAIIGDVSGVQVVASTVGSSVLGKIGENHGEIVVKLDGWKDRTRTGRTLKAVSDEIASRLKSISSATFTLLHLPPINGMGGTGGVSAYLCAIGSVEPAELAADAEAYAAKMLALPQIANVATSFSASTPMLHFDVDRDKAQALGVSAATIFSTMQNQLASFYVNDFNLAGGAHQVIVQNDYDARTSVECAEGMRFPGVDGAMVPLSAIGNFRYTLGPRVITRFNKLMAACVVMVPSEGVSTLEVIDLVEKNPPDPSKYVLNWSLMNTEERASRGRLGGLVSLALVFAYLILVARYESWTLPVPILMTSAVAVAGAATGLYLSGGMYSVYALLGMLLLLEYPVRNASVIVDAAIRLRAQNLPLADAARQGASIGLRQSFLSCIAYVAALLPLICATGVGAASQRALGVTVIFGVLAANLLGLMFVPSLYVAVCHLCWGSRIHEAAKCGDK